MTRIDFPLRMPINQWSQVISHPTITMNLYEQVMPQVWAYVVALG